MKTTLNICRAAALALMIADAGAQSSNSVQQITSSVFASAGGTSSGGGYTVAYTLGESIAGNPSAGDDSPASGFWALDAESSADLRVRIVSDKAAYRADDPVTFTITVSNAGPNSATGLVLTHFFDVFLELTSVNPGSGTSSNTTEGIEARLSELAPGAMWTVTVSGVYGTPMSIPSVAHWDSDISPDFPESVIASNHVSLVGAEVFFESSDLSATLVFPIFQKLDFGRAPLPYPTVLPNAARHGITFSDLYLGSRVDAETNGQPAMQSEADEDGVANLQSIVIRGESAVVGVGVTASKAGRLDAWIDLDVDGAWEPGEKIVDNVSLAPGSNYITFPVGPGVSPTARLTWARFRVSSAGGLSPTGYAPDGEVEDYAVQIVNVPPTVTLTSPAAGSTFNFGSPITLSATASAANGKTIAYVQFLDGSNTLGQDVSVPYSLVVSNLAAGGHLLSARAVDNFGGDASSAPIPIAVVAPCTGPIFTWNVASGNWSVPGNWTTPAGTPASPPGVNDRVVIDNGGTVMVDADVAVCTLNLANGTIDGSFNLTINGVMNWTSGNMSGSGRTVVGPSATLFLATASSVTITSRTLENKGMVSQTGGGVLYSFGAVFANNAGAVWLALSNQEFGGTSGARFDNYGIFRRATTGASTLFAGTAFNNYGLVDVLAGATLQFWGGGEASSTIANAGRIDWASSAYTLKPGAQVTGSGINSVRTTLTLNTDVVLQNVELTDQFGAIAGTGNLTIGERLVWTAGAMVGGGRTRIVAGATLHLADMVVGAAVYLTTRTLLNEGTVAWTGRELSCSGTVISNAPGAVWDSLGGGTHMINGQNTTTFYNGGLVRNAGNATFSRLAFTNSGTVDVRSGTVSYNESAFAHSGPAMSIASGCLVQFWGGGEASSTIANAGRIDWASSAYTLKPGAQVTGSGINSVRTTLTLNTDVVLQNVELTDQFGAIAGTGNLTIGERLVWTAGAMGGGGQTRIVAGATLHLADMVVGAAVYLTTRRLLNEGTVSWTGRQLSCSGTVISNAPGAVWDSLSGGTHSINGQNTTTFYNDGLVRNAGNANFYNIVFNNDRMVETLSGTLYYDGSPFNNYGTNHVAGGTLQLASSYIQYAGATELCSGNIVNSSALQITGGVINGIGSISGSLSISGTGINSPGCSPGRLTVGGDYSQAAGGTLDIEIGGPVPGDSHDQLVIGGAAALAGTLRVSFVNDFVPQSSDTFTILIAGTRNGAFESVIYSSNQLVMAVSNMPSAVLLRVESTGPAGADLQVELTGVPETISANQPISYAVTVRNAGPDTATGVAIINPFHWPRLAGPTATASQGSCEMTSNEVRCALGTLNAGATAIVQITVTPRPAESLAIEARASSATPDANLSNNHASGLVVLQPLFPPDCFCACFTNGPGPWPSPDPLLTSWYTEGSGQYAEVRLKDGAGTQTNWIGGHFGAMPPETREVRRVYADIQKIQSFGDSVYVTAFGLASHVMGPWYCDPSHPDYPPTMPDFPNQPLDLNQITRIRRHSIPNTAHPVTPMGSIGIWVNGTAIYNMLDGLYYDTNASNDTDTPMIFGPPTGLNGYWHRDAYRSERLTFDPAVYHQQSSGQYHSHASPLLLRWQLKDNLRAVVGPSNSVVYLEKTNRWHHSPILGWAYDGHPIYGPYGYDEPMNTNSSVRRMISGYVLRDGSYGTTDLNDGRTTLPSWVLCMQPDRNSRLLATNDFGPDPGRLDTNTNCNPIEWTLGRYAEDYAYLGDLLPASDYGVVWDMDRYNGRCCKTPEFPDGTYAYFVTIGTNDLPAFPYVIGWQYCSSTNDSGVVTTVPQAATTEFEASHPRILPPAAGSFGSNGLLTLQWKSRQDATYRAFSSSNLQVWTPVSPLLPSQGTMSSHTLNLGLPLPAHQYFKLEAVQDGGGARPPNP